MSSDPILTAQNITRRFRIGQSEITVLRAISLELHAGEKLFLCGASGAGKTTLLYTLAGLERPNEGDVCFKGYSFFTLPGKKQAEMRNRHFGFVFQNYHLLPELTAIENVLLPLYLGGISNEAGEKKAASILEKVGLGARLHHLPTELSGGEQQRVAIARSLINDPDVLFADEPTGNLDSKNGSQVLALLLDLAEEAQKALVIVTHDTTVARLGDRSLTLVDGKI